MATRREILEASLKKKQDKFDQDLSIHMDDVRGAQGEPMAGHSGGEKVLSRWEKQNKSLKRQNDSIEKTKRALEREDDRDYNKQQAANLLKEMPKIFQDMVADGTLNQWIKYPNTFFVEGVEKARIQFKKGKAFHKYARHSGNYEQFQKFKAVYNQINQVVNLGD